MTQTIGLFANRALRDGPDSLLIRFVREFEPYWREVLKPRIYALEGTFRALLRHGLLHDYPDLHPLPPGRQGGIVALTDMVVANGQQAEGAPRRMDSVIYLMDSRDATSMLPDSVALKRECVVTGTTFLATFAAAAEWYLMQWFIDRPGAAAGPALPAWFVDGALRRALAADHAESIETQTIALIAHDSKKRDMVDFAERHFGLLARFRTRLATGTTGTLLNGERPQRLLRAWDELEEEVALFARLGAIPGRLKRAVDEKAALEAAVDRLRTRLPEGRWVEAQPSGPRGGDIQIAEAVRRGQCQRLLFFEDPLVSREHEADIQLLERTTRIPEHEVMCLHDAHSAAQWARKLDTCLELGGGLPMTLCEAFRRLWNVELVLSDCEAQPEHVWHDVLGKAAWYVHGLLVQRGRERLHDAAPLRVAVTWGREIHELLDRIEAIPSRLQALEAQHPALHHRLLDEHFRVPGNVLALPMIGIVGATDPRNEANFNAAALAALSGGTARSLPLYAFCDRASDSDAARVPDALHEDWNHTDIAISTCDGLRRHFSANATGPIPHSLHDQLEGESVGEIGGIYITPQGREIAARAHRRIGIGEAQLARVAHKRGSVLIAAVQERRLAPALAALRGGLVSTLVSDVGFARRLLALHARATAGGA